MWYKNTAGRFFGLVKKHACDGRNKAIADGNLCTRYVAPPGECIENFDCLSHGATNIDNANANATCQRAHYVKRQRHTQNRKYTVLRAGRATAPENMYRKFRKF